MKPEIKPDSTYYVYEDKVYLFKEDIFDELSETYAGLDDDFTEYSEDLNIEEIDGVELLERIGDDDICLMWD